MVITDKLFFKHKQSKNNVTIVRRAINALRLRRLRCQTAPKIGVLRTQIYLI